MQIDELVVKLVLDATGFGKGTTDATAATGKLKQGVMADAKATEESVAKVTAGVEALGRRFLGLYALVTAGRGLREFVSDLTGADSALGRTARNIDLGAKALSTWQLAAEASGGSAAGITGAMRNLSGELQRAALTGQSSIIPAFKAMGINLADAGGRARDVRDIFRDLNKVAQTMDPARFTALANLAGISDEGTISMLEMKTSEFNKLIAAQEKYAATAEDVDAAQKRQSGWRELLITSTSIGRTILTAVTPALVAMMKAVQDWANGKDWTKLSKPISDFLDTLTNADWKGFIGQAEDFATKLNGIVTAADGAAKGVDGNSTLFKGLEALGVLAGVKVLGSVLSLTAGLGRLSGIPVTGMLARILMNPVLAGTLGIGALLASGDPDKSVLAGGRPDVQPQDNDLGLPGTGQPNEDRRNDTTRPQGVWDWIRANAMPDFGKAYDQLKAMGFGDRLPKGSDDVPAASPPAKGLGNAPAVPLPPERPATFAPNTDGNALRRNDETPAGAQHGSLWDSLKRLVGFGDDPKVRDSVEATAKATAGIYDLMRNGATASGLEGPGGVTASSGGLGGSGRHVGGATSPGATLRDHGQAGRGAGPSALKSGQQKGNAAAIADEMRKAGMSDEGIAAVLGSMQTESGFSPRAHNDVAGGHTGLWQWDARRWAKVRGWIEKQGGDPWDARWQAKAFIAEGRAKPGDAIYDNGNTSGGFDDIMGAKGNLPKAVHGVQRSERFGVGEEGGRAANAAKWLGHLPSATDVPGAGTSTPSATVTDGDVSAARARLTAGHPRPGDTALIARYLKEQNTPPPAAKGPAMPAHHALHAALSAIGHANRLTHHGGAVPVDVTETSAKRLAHPLNEALRRRAVGAGRAGYNHGIERAMDQASSLAHMHRAASFARHVEAMNHTVQHNDNSSTTSIGSMTVHTRATDGRELIADIDRHLARHREVAQSNSGLA